MGVVPGEEMVIHGLQFLLDDRDVFFQEAPLVRTARI
jgi:hypothetical protein